ncbi:hypothetical protein M5D96_002713 [Drosophila gunungcola]|uniref:Uncharacterized protein n=1 Tax=Drosophila gunungcola TaxID=103775 RepID=A0A9P9Z0F2_9MUSC|nr:hypothetical protein M5D96_002713 [Drosophila gunungcola]
MTRPLISANSANYFSGNKSAFEIMVRLFSAFFY